MRHTYVLSYISLYLNIGIMCLLADSYVIAKTLAFMFSGKSGDQLFHSCCKTLSSRLLFQIRVITGSGHPDYRSHLGHALSGSSGSHPSYKISGCDPDSVLGHVWR